MDNMGYNCGVGNMLIIFIETKKMSYNNNVSRETLSY